VTNFDDLTKVDRVVRLKSKAIFIGPRSSSQQRLFDRVYLLRERDQVTFEVVANQARTTVIDGQTRVAGPVVCMMIDHLLLAVQRRSCGRVLRGASVR